MQHIIEILAIVMAMLLLNMQFWIPTGIMVKREFQNLVNLLNGICLIENTGNEEKFVNKQEDIVINQNAIHICP